MEKEIIISSDEYKGTIRVDYVPCINYAMILNNKKTFNKFEVYAERTSRPWKNVSVTITGEMLQPYQKDFSKQNAGEAVSLDDAALVPVATKLATLSEAMQSSFVVCVTIDGTQVLRHALPVTFMAYDQWHGINVSPELVPAFVTPNHPLIAPICKKASNLLDECYMKKGFDDYQSKDTGWIAKQVEAVYIAISQCDITYATVPASFEEYGQRIRLVDKIMKDKMANCIDLSLLMCSCLESIGINTVQLLFKGHAMMGFWLKPLSKRTAVNYDVKALKNDIEGNDYDLEILDATALTRGVTLVGAINEGRNYLEKNTNDFEFLVDIFAARAEGVRPLPHVNVSEAGFSFPEQSSVESIPTDEGQSKVSAGKLKNKQQLWERKLLDLSLRNTLLNLKPSKNILPVESIPIDVLLRHLKNGSLLHDLDVKDLEQSAKDLSRSARLSIEENGANTLFLAIGTLRWYEADDDRPYLAPILFLPVEIVRQASHKYIIRQRDEEPIVNITLIEMLRQNFEVELSPISLADEDEDGQLDWKRAFSIINKCSLNIW